MSWMRPVAKKAATYGAKYGPHAVVIWNVAGEHVQAAARAKAAEIAERRKAFAEADSVVDGSVLRVVEHGTTVFVVFSGDEPVASYPDSTTPLDQLIARADLAKRVTPEQRRDRGAVNRARRAARTARRGRRGHGAD